MRAYFFGNMYLSSIQQGIQAQHCTAELFLKYSLYGKLTGDFIGEKQRVSLYEWADNHKTSILLNGGDCAGLSEIFLLLDSPDNPYPWAIFVESNDALRNALTCVGIILPERIYEAAGEMRQNRNNPQYGRDLLISDWEYDLCLQLNSCGMAR